MATQKEIAARLGVSVSLVSRVLSGTASGIGICQDTIDRVLREAGRRNYSPNPHAQALKGLPPKTLGVLVTDFEDPFLAVILNQLQRLSQPLAYTLFVHGFDVEDSADPSTSTNGLRKFNPDGFIWIGSGLGADQVKALTALERPVVHIGSGPEFPNVGHLLVDETAAAKLFCAEVYKRGHRRIALLADALPVHRDRLDIFLTEIRRRGLAVPNEWIVKADSMGDEGGELAAEHLIAACSPDRRPSVIFAAGDVVAFGALRTLHRQGWAVPADCSLVGFDDIPPSRLLVPRLATIAQPVATMAQKALDLLIDPAADVNRGSRFSFKPLFVVRESLGNP